MKKDSKMRLNLKKFYFVFVLPFFFLMILLFIIQKLGVQIVIYESSKMISFVFLILSVLFAFVVPLWYRLTFLKSWQDKEIELNRREFLNFEKNYMILPLITPYIIIVSYVFGVSKIPMGVIAIIGIYSVYYYYPSKRRYNLEKRIFNIKEQ